MFAHQIGADIDGGKFKDYRILNKWHSGNDQFKLFLLGNKAI